MMVPYSIPKLAIVSYASNTPQTDVGLYIWQKLPSLEIPRDLVQIFGGSLCNNGAAVQLLSKQSGQLLASTRF